MHPTRRLLTLLVLCAAAATFSGGAAVLRADIRGEIEGEFEQVLARAKSSYLQRRGVATSQKNTQQTAAEAHKQVVAVGKEKQRVRFAIVQARGMAQDLRNRIAKLEAEQHRLDRIAQTDEERFLSLLRSNKLQAFVTVQQQNGIKFLFRRLLSLSLGAGVEREFQESFVARAREEFLVSLLQAREMATARLATFRKQVVTAEENLTTLTVRHEQLIAQYREADKVYEKAQREALVSEEQLLAFKAEMARVQADVLRLQAEMARFDARIRAKAERELIEKGLMDPRQGGASGVSRLAKLHFTWPVFGPVTATFHDAAYFKRFGVPHEGADIAQGQGSPVSVAADGVVFIVRDGGAKGYTYVLIAHRDGYATLYGHLSSVAVAAGDDVVQGQTIGLSGGQPGTPGAGLLTTGPHLHFEVIKNGTNINPLSVLP
ncbi:MAG: peptidoglycan DD-metalloendopeptidase family protein [Candidatus Peribacteraceae bacterium]|jgi:murein DD-endopeptidase MepM/ murein hydrolase activator NlpD